jgi:tRNA nucleotidyltransferase (CCA-adding enzyme)
MLCRLYRIPNAHHELAKITSAWHVKAHHAKSFSAEELLTFFYRIDYFRRGQRFLDFLTVCTAIYPDFDAAWLRHCAEAAKSYPVQKLIVQGLDGAELAEQLRLKRQEKIAEWLDKGL